MTFLVSPQSSWLCARGADRIGEYCYYGITLHGDLPPLLRPWAFLVRRLYMLTLFLIGAPWLLRWWGLRRYLGCFSFYVVHNFTFEMDYGELLAEMRPRGVLHVGASVAQEAQAYAAAGVRRVIWIEAQPSLETPLRAAVAAADKARWPDSQPPPPGAGPEVLMAAVTEQSGNKVTMVITANSISSSLLPIGRGHATYLPFIKAVPDKAVTVETVTMRDLLRRHRVDTSALDMVYLDTQGSELSVLRGCDDALLAQMKAIMTEVSTEEHYQGGCLMSELDAFLGARGFTRTRTRVPPLGHGNALYERMPADKKAQ
jgi:FkbM family methyltransferase